MLKGYKTILFNLMAALVPLLELTEMREVIPDNYLPIYMLAVAMGNLYLRTVTTTPVGKG
jgi:hypothetical protein